MTPFASLDNNLIDSVFSNLLTMNEDQLSVGLLAEKELIYHLRKITKDLEYIYDMGFVKFWAYMIKFPLFIENIDNFL